MGGLLQMGPKKKLSKADEDRVELVRLRYSLQEADQRIAEQQKTIQHLRDLHSHQSSEYTNLQRDADRLAGDYQRSLDYMEEELSTSKEALEYQLSTAKQQLLSVT